MTIQAKYTDITLSAIQTITDRKLKAKTSPTHATKTELKMLIMAGVDKTLDNLVSDGKIKIGETMNDKYVEICEE